MSARTFEVECLSISIEAPAQVLVAQHLLPPAVGRPGSGIEAADELRKIATRFGHDDESDNQQRGDKQLDVARQLVPHRAGYGWTQDNHRQADAGQDERR